MSAAKSCSYNMQCTDGLNTHSPQRHYDIKCTLKMLPASLSQAYTYIILLYTDLYYVMERSTLGIGIHARQTFDCSGIQSVYVHSSTVDYGRVTCPLMRGCGLETTLYRQELGHG